MRKGTIKRCFSLVQGRSGATIFSGKTPWVGLSGLHCKRISLCVSHCGWTESDHFGLLEHKEVIWWSGTDFPWQFRSLCHKIYKAYLSKLIFLLWWKLEALFPNILHQTIYNLCKICEFENTFPTITHYEYSKICSLCFFFPKDAVPSSFLFLWKKIWISYAIAQDLAYLKY